MGVSEDTRKTCSWVCHMYLDLFQTNRKLYLYLVSSKILIKFVLKQFSLVTLSSMFLSDLLLPLHDEDVLLI